jgi:basic membrane lipoprotein Med (substrate-binding protein (PBP1-ABC) superfamily)
MKRLMALLTASAALAGLLAMAPAAAEDKPLTVGAIYVESVNDYGYDRAMKDGLEEMKKNIPGLKLIEAENVPETAESERIMEGMIQQGAKLIFATSFGHQQFAFNRAKTHPDVVFEHAGGWMQAPNFGNFFGATQAAWYPMGVAAGKMTKSNTLGFVVGVPIGYAIGNVNAFEMGARSVNPQAQTRVVVTGGWADKAKEAAAANALIDQGADVVTMHVDSPATIVQVAESRSGTGRPRRRHDGGGAVRDRGACRRARPRDGRGRPDRQGLQSFHRSGHRQHRRHPHRRRRGLGRRQDGQFRLVCAGRDRQGQIGMP